MSEQHKELVSAPDQDEADEQVPAEDPADWLLGHLIDLMAAFGVSNDLTLLCNGVLVVGSPISDDRYFELLGSTIVDGLRTAPLRAHNVDALPERMRTEDELRAYAVKYGEALQGSLSETGKQLQQSVRARLGLSDDDAPPPRQVRKYVNLQWVTISRGRDDETDVPLWRGRISEVSGWSWGRSGIDAYEGP